MKKLLYLFLALLFINQHIIAQVPSYVPTDALVGYWPFNGNANDETGNGNNGVVSGPTLTTDRFGNNNSAYSFTVNSSASWGSAQDRITITNPTIPNDNSFAMSGWVNLSEKPSPYNNREHSLMGRWDGDGTIVFRNQINYSGQIYTVLANDGLNLSEYSSGNVSYGNWQHVVITYDGSVLKHYKNGQLTGQEILNVNINTSTASLTFGEIHMANGHWLLFSGKMDDLGYWSRALTDQEITNLYNSETLSIDDQNLTNILIYPNPVVNKLFIQGLTGPIKVTVYNILGELVLSKTTSSEINVGNLQRGIYIVEIINEQKTTVKKFIKN